MTEQKTLAMIFTLSVVLIVLCMLTLFLSIQLALMIFLIGCFIASISVHTLFKETMHKAYEEKQKERNVREIYRYDQLLDPPELNN